MPAAPGYRGTSRRKYGTAGRVATAIRKSTKARANRVWESRASAQSLNMAVRQVVLGRHEQKMSFGGGENIQLWHNGTTSSGGFYFPLNYNLLATNTGTTQFTRIGDAIYSQSLNFKVWLSNKLDRPNVMYRIMVISGENADIASPLTGLMYATSGQTVVHEHINKDKFKCHYDRIIQPFSGDYSLEPSATNREHSRMIQFSVPTRKRIVYKADNGSVPGGANTYAIVVAVYDAYGTLTTNDIATTTWVYQHMFKDE